MIKKIWNKIDDSLNKLSSLILVILVILLFWVFTHKVIIGQYMMYEDYYEQKINDGETKRWTFKILQN